MVRMLATSKNMSRATTYYSTAIFPNARSKEQTATDPHGLVVLISLNLVLKIEVPAR